MTKVMLIAGVAALAIAASATAGPKGHGGGHGGGNPHGGQSYAAPQQQQRGGRGGGGGHAFAAPRQDHGGGFRMQEARAQQVRQRDDQRQAMRRQQMQRQAMQHQRGEQRQAMRQQQMQRQAMQHQRGEQRRAMRQQQMQRQAMQHQRDDQRQAVRQQQMQRQAMQHQRDDQRQAMQRQRNDRHQVMQQRDFNRDRLAQARMRDQIRDQRQDYARNAARQFADNDFARGYANVRYSGDFNRCPPGLRAKGNGCLPPGQAVRLLGAPLSRVAAFAPLAEVPQPLRYLYPETPDYYYRYGDGYMYQVDRSSNVISSLLPLIAGGYMPGMTFPASYRNSYVPDYYGYNSFYPDTDYSDYRYLDGNVYSVDPYSGTIQDVIPTYGYGYGVGQMLPAGYGYYNVPNQYRSVYYNTPDYNYWYAPGAIYQVDPSTQLITSVASLLAPGMSVGQPLPMGYGTYNVPMAYRSTYYDTPNAWYRYNNGNIYQVDPTTQIVTAIVASLLT